MLLLMLTATLAADPVAADFPDRARSFVLTVHRGEFAAAAKDFDATMAKVLPAEKLQKVWEQVTGRFGAFQEATGTRMEEKGKFTMVYVTSKFEKGALDVRVVFDADRKISGLQFLPPKPTVEYRWPEYVKPDTFSEKDVTFAAEPGWELPGALTMPKEGRPVPAFVLVHGSGAHDRDESIGPNRPFKDLAGGLASRGIGVLRYEKRTRQHGAKLAAGGVTIQSELIDDALAAVKYLRREPGVDAARVFVLGHSLGGMYAPKLATLDTKLGGIVILAGAARPIEDLIKEQTAYVLKVSGESEDSVRERLDRIKEQVTRVKDPNLSPDTPSDRLPFGAPASYWLSLRGYDAAAVAANLKTRLLLLHADRDYQVTLDDHAIWDKALSAKPHATLRRYPDLNHLFMSGQGKATPGEYQKEGHVAAEVIDDIVRWVRQ